MIDFPYMTQICKPTASKILFLVVDGLGGLANPETGLSELETAKLPNLDKLSQKSDVGLTTPVAPGITPGSGPGHMALFGYNPIKYLVGRGILEALGMDIDIGSQDIVARGNLATVDSSGIILDRRACRMPSEKSAALLKPLSNIKITDTIIQVFPGKEHRFVVRLRGNGLSDKITETDPQNIGVPILKAQSISPDSIKTAEIVNAFTNTAVEILSSQIKGNAILLRGFSKMPELPSMRSVYNLNPAAIAAYPMYQGLAKLVGMHVIKTGKCFNDQLDSLETHMNKHDFFFLHYKPTDVSGEDGIFSAKVDALEKLDSYIPRLLSMGFETVTIAGDHSTPSIMGKHSWHPVPFLINSANTKVGVVKSFNERTCLTGSIGHITATSLITLTLAHAGKLLKFGP